MMKREIIKYFKDDLEYDGNIYIKQTDINNKFGYECYSDPEYKLKLEMRKVIDDTVCINITKNKKRSQQNIVDENNNQVSNDEQSKIKNSKILYLLCPVIILVNIIFR